MNELPEDPYQCIGYCQVDDAGYCLGCGRPTQMRGALRTSDADSLRGEMPAVDSQSPGDRFPVDPLPQ